MKPSRYTIGDKFTLLQLAKLLCNSDLEHASSCAGLSCRGAGERSAVGATATGVCRLCLQHTPVTGGEITGVTFSFYVPHVRC